MSEIFDEDEGLYEQASLEEDVPLNDLSCNNRYRFNIVEERFKQESKDKDHNRKLIDALTNKGFMIIMWCFIIIVAIHIIDIIILSCGLEVSGLTTPIFELCKSTITMLLGFLFAKNIDYKK